MIDDYYGHYNDDADEKCVDKRENHVKLIPDYYGHEL